MYNIFTTEDELPHCQTPVGQWGFFVPFDEEVTYGIHKTWPYRLNVSRLCLGTMNFGAATDEKEAFRIMDAALDAGINFFDTANNYGFMVGKVGITEEIIGRWFAQGNGRREKTVLATKVHEDMFDPLDGPNSAPGLSAYKIRRHLEGSLRRLKTDHIELYYMHHIDRSCSFEELWDSLESIAKRGLADYIGASNFPA